MRFMDLVVHIIRNIDCNFTLHFQSNFPSNTLRFESIIVRLLNATYEKWLSREHLIRKFFFCPFSLSLLIRRNSSDEYHSNQKSIRKFQAIFGCRFQNLCIFWNSLFHYMNVHCTLEMKFDQTSTFFHGLSIIKVLLVNWWSRFHCADRVKYSIAEHKTGVYWNLLAWFSWKTSMSIEIKW